MNGGLTGTSSLLSRSQKLEGKAVVYLRGNVRGAANARFHRSGCSYLPAETLVWQWPELRGLTVTGVLLRTFLVKPRIQPCLHCFPEALLLRSSPPEYCEDCAAVLGEERHGPWCEA